jgi:cytochrome c
MPRLWRTAIAICLPALLAAAGSGAGAAGLEEHGGPVKGVAVSKDGRQALSASFDYSLILWDLPAARVIRHLYGHDAAVNDVAFLPDDAAAVSVSDDGTLAVWDLETGELTARIEAHLGKAVAVAVSPDGRLAASAGWDRTVRLWDLAKGQRLLELEGPDNFNDVAFSDDGAHLIAGGANGDLFVWRVADGTRQAELEGHDFAITNLALGTKNGLAVTASVDETVQLWDLGKGSVTGTLYGHHGPVLAVALSADGRLVASGGIDGTVRVWRRGDGDRLRVYDRHRGPVWSVAFAPEGDVLLSGGADGLVLTYDLDQGSAAEPAPEPPVAALQTEGDGRGAELFRKCSACHTLTPDGGHRAGPTLHGVFGREAGGQPDYPYSPALRESELVWTEETVSRLFEIGPDKLVPGSKMPLQRMPSAKDRAELIDYLKRATVPGSDK